MADIDKSHADEAHRLRLRVIAKAMLGVAFLSVVFVFLSAFLSGDREAETTPALRVNVADVRVGETIVEMWEGKPVLIQRRAPETIAALEAGPAPAPELRDPDGVKSEQPDSAGNPLRSATPEWFVALGLGTDYGCPVRALPADPGEDFAGSPWAGGFVDECRGSRYDGAGRVFAGQYADRNLVVPEHALRGDTMVITGR